VVSAVPDAVSNPVPDPGPGAAEPVASVFVQTRGRPRHRDYDFLGGGPGEPWWRAYAGHTAFERPTVLVESDGVGYRVYLSGIPSGRRDAVGTVIRYTVVLRADGDGPPAVPPDGVLTLLGCWLDDQAGPDLARGAGPVSRALDAQFPEDEVERMLAAARPVAPAEVRDRVLAAVAALPPATPTDAVDGDLTDWWGDAGAPAARAAFRERTARLLTGGVAGRALLLNLVGSAPDLAALADGRPLAVLAPEVGQVVGGSGMAPLDPGRVDPGKARPSATAAAPRTASTVSSTASSTASAAPPSPAVVRAATRVGRLPAVALLVVVLVIGLLIPLLIVAPLLLLPLLGR
jgi:hypothetical protein